jgi:hypothetical protein
MVEFPISGPYREPLLSLEFIFLSIILEFAIYFFHKYKNNKKEISPSNVELDWAIIFLSFGVMKSFYIIGDFYYVYRPLIATFGYLSITFGGFIFLFSIESKKLLNTKYFFSIFSGSLLIILIVMIFIDPSINQLIAPASAGIAYIAIILYFSKLIGRIWQNYKLYGLGAFVGIILWLIGFSWAADFIINFFGLYIRIIGDVILLAGIIIFAISINFLPSLAEFGWRDKIKYILILDRRGLCLFNMNFQKKEEMNEILLGGALSGAKTFLQDMLKKETPLKTISKGSDVFIMEEGNYVMGILVAEKELVILKKLLNTLIIRFEENFSNILQNWSGGQIELFKPADQLIRKIFFS